MELFLFSLLAFVVIASLISWSRGYGLDWLKWWPVWLVVVLGSGAIAFTSRTERISVGAEWLQRRTSWVRLYELTSVSIRYKAANVELHLTDSEGRRVQIQTMDLQKDRLMWDLVYNGIRHSVVAGAATNRAAERVLQLP